jgi:Resolvase, N terminal domain
MPVSTINGHQSPEMQLLELREYAARRGWKIIEEYVDAGVSGSKDSRPALNRLMADACQRRLGRPPVFVNAQKIADLRERGYSWAQVVAETGTSMGSAQRALAGLPKNPSDQAVVSA